MTQKPVVEGTWSAWKPLILGMIGILILVGGFGGWAVMTSITGAVIAPGQIEVDQNRQVVQHPDGGVVEGIYVAEGDEVEAGDLLIRLDAESLATELSVTESQLFEVLARRARFEAERDSASSLSFDPLLLESENPVTDELMEGQQRLYEARIESERQVRDQLGKRRDQISSQIDGIESQQAALQTQLELIDEELASQQSLLDRGLAQATRVLALEREKANLAGRVGELTASAAQAEGRITEIDIQIIRIETDRREQAITNLRDLQAQELELAERRRALITQLERLEIRAPVSGVIYNMQVFAPRSVIRPADPVLYVIPQDRPLIITARVSPRDIDQIYVGQDVSLRFSAFDSRTTPELFGHVVQVSADAFVDEASRSSYYRAEVRLDDGQIERLPSDRQLVPGMPVDAFIATEARSPMAYLIQPFTDYFVKAFRET